MAANASLVPLPVIFHGSLDVCVKDIPYRAALCSKIAFFTALSFITAILCIVKAIRLSQGVNVEKYHVGALVLGAAQCAVLSVHWGVNNNLILHFTAIYLLVLQYLVLCIFYGGLAVKILDRRGLLTYVCYPAAAILAAYFTFVLVFACVNQHPNDEECLEPQWLLFSSSQFALAQLFLAAGIHLHRTMSSMRHVHASYISSKKTLLWSLIIIFELSSIASFSFDLALRLGVPSLGTCDSMFGEPDTPQYVFIVWTQLLLAFMLPVWTTLFVVKPAMKSGDVAMSTLKDIPRRSVTWGTINDEDEESEPASPTQPLLRK